MSVERVESASVGPDLKAIGVVVSVTPLNDDWAGRTVTLSLPFDVARHGKAVLFVRIRPDSVEPIPFAIGEVDRNAVAALPEPGTYALVAAAPPPLPGCKVDSTPGDFSIRSESQLTALESESFIEGSLLISINGPTDLSALSCLRSVGGSLGIDSNDGLVSLTGLEGLVSVGGFLRVYGNDGLLAASLPGVRFIGGRLYIGSNVNLQSMQAGTLARIDGDLDISDNGSVTSTATVLLGSVQQITGDIEIRNNDGLVDVGLEGLRRIDGRVFVSNNTSLSNTNGWRNVATVGGTVSFQSNPQLEVVNLAGLTRVESVNFTFNYALQTVDLRRLPEVYNFTFTHNGSQSTTTSLDLAELARVGGQIIFIDNPGLVNLGDGGLVSVAEHVVVRDNPSLSRVASLATLEEVGDYIAIERNNELRDIYLNALEDIDGGVGIFRNSKLRRLEITALRTTGGLNVSLNGAMADVTVIDVSALESTGGLVISGNARLENLDGLASLTSLESALIITDNPALQNTHGLGRLSEVGAGVSVTISDNDALMELDLGALSTVHGVLEVDGNDRLLSADFGQLEAVDGWLRITSNGALAAATTLDFGALVSVSRDFEVANNPSLLNIDKFSSLRTVGERVDVRDNESLVNIDGLAGLESAGDIIAISYNDALTTIRLDGLVKALGTLGFSENPRLEVIRADRLEIAKSLSISNVGALASSADFELSFGSLREVQGYLSIGFVPHLRSLDGVVTLQRVDGTMQILSNSRLENVDGLDNVTHIGRSILIGYNESLVSLGFGGLQALGDGPLEIIENGSLPTCVAVALRDRLEAAGYAGFTIIDANLPDACTP